MGAALDVLAVIAEKFAVDKIQWCAGVRAAVDIGFDSQAFANEHEVIRFETAVSPMADRARVGNVVNLSQFDHGKGPYCLGMER